MQTISCILGVKPGQEDRKWWDCLARYSRDFMCIYQHVYRNTSLREESFAGSYRQVVSRAHALPVLSSYHDATHSFDNLFPDKSRVAYLRTSYTIRMSQRQTF